MKLAEALLQRAEYQNKIAALDRQLDYNIKMQEGDTPEVDPDWLISEILDLNDKLCELIQRINHTNYINTLDNGQTLISAIAKRESLAKKQKLITSVIDKASNRNFRMTKSEIKIINTVSIADLQSRADAFAREFRMLDTAIQAKNWTVELVEF